MRLNLVSIAALMPALALADTLGLNSQPLFYSLTGDNPTYHDAAYKAQEAFFLQTGITPMVDKVAGYVKTDATNKATTVINSDTPLDAKTVFFMGGAAYAICIKKQVTQKFHDPFFHTVTHTITVNQTSASTGIQIPLPF